MSPTPCPRCDTEVDDGIECVSCQNLFHFVCGGTTEAKFRNLPQNKRDQWKCINCKSRRDVAVDDTKQQSSEITEILAIVKRTEKECKSVKSEIKGLKNDIKDNNKAIEFCNGQIKDLSEKLCGLEIKAQKIDSHEEDIASLQNQISTLTAHLEEQDQRARIHNVEIRNIPPSKNENLLSLMQKISTAIDFDWQESEIEFATRVAPSKQHAAKVKPIIIKFRSKSQKDHFLSAFKKRKGITTSDVGLAGESHKIFASDHLTRNNKALLHKAKTAAKEKGFQFVWVTDCKILVRRNDQGDSPIIRIQHEADLKKLT